MRTSRMARSSKARWDASIMAKLSQPTTSLDLKDF